MGDERADAIEVATRSNRPWGGRTPAGRAPPVNVGVLGSAALALALGLRHGLDADHLAAIDGLTRFNLAARRGFAPYCGALFSAGHGGAIFAAACAIALLAAQWAPPAWLELTGKIVSAAILLVLGIYNLHIGLKGDSDRSVRPVGLRAGIFAAALRSSRSWQVALVGVLFALSFDALGLAALFAASAAPIGGVPVAAFVSLAFAVGMVLVDASNGVWVARLAARSDVASVAASRTMTLTIALISLVMGACMALSAASASLDHWLTGHEITVSALVILAVLAGYAGARILPWALGCRRALNAHSSSG